MIKSSEQEQPIRDKDLPNINHMVHGFKRILTFYKFVNGDGGKGRASEKSL